jgi:hypothetical protein
MEDQGPSFLKWLPNLLAFAFACYGVLFQPTALNTARPVVPMKAEEQSGQRAYARLWDDPFAVFPQEPKPVQEDRTAPDPGDVLLLCVLADSFGYAEDKEFRLRVRFAVEKSLTDLDYTPFTSDVLDSLVIPGWPANTEETGPLNPTATPPNTAEPVQFPKDPIKVTQANVEPGAGGLRVPFQDFRLKAISGFSDRLHNLLPPHIGPARFPFSRVRVLWFNENALSASMLRNLTTGLADPHFRSWLAQHDSPSEISVAVLGPSSSGTLTGMIDPPGLTSSVRASDNDPDLPRVRLINYSATVADEYLKLLTFDESHPEHLSKRGIAETMEAIKDNLHQPISAGAVDRMERTTCTDFELCKELAEEIRRRRPIFPSLRPELLILYETDTLYGRALAATMQTVAKFPALSESRGLLAPLIDHAALDPAALDVQLVGYLRGLDGYSSYYRKQYIQEQGESGSSDSGSTTEDSSQSRSSHQSDGKRGLDRAEGPSQFDYMRRIASAIDPKHPPSAVAIFGTDVFDKLTLLKILRERLPDSLFLSTDLDALYFAAENLSFTRKLVLASPYGLNPPDENQRSQRDVSFRSSYQSSIYVGVRAAVLRIPLTPELTGAGPTRSQPLLFEVGNFKPVKLLVTSSGAADSAGSILDGTNPRLGLWLQLLTILTGVLFLFLAILPTLRRAREFPRELYEALQTAIRDNNVARFFCLYTGILITSGKQWDLAQPLAAKTIDFAALEANLANLSDQSLRKVLTDALQRLRQKLELIASRRINLQRWQQKLSYFAPSGIDRFSESWQIIRQKNALSQFSRTVENALLTPEQIDTGVFKELDALRRYRAEPGPMQTGNEIVITTLVVLLFFYLCGRVAPLTWGLLGLELRSQSSRVLRLVLGFAEVWLAVWTIYIVCREQIVCRQLIDRFAKFIDEISGLNGRLAVFVIAYRCEPISRLSIYPCSLIFLLFVGHMQALNGAPVTIVHFFGAATMLLTLFLLSNAVRSAGRAAREECLKAYNIDILRANRALSNIASVVADDRPPMQDSLARVTREINDLAERNSLGHQIPEGQAAEAPLKLEKSDLQSSTMRQKIRDYLAALVTRNREVIAYISTLKSGALSPLALSPFFLALLIPIAGAGGLKLLEFAAQLLRG